MLDRLPGVAQQLRYTIQQRTDGKPNAVAKVERAASADVQSAAVPARALRLEQLRHRRRLLIAGDLFRRRLIEIAGPTLSKKKITLQILDDISVQIGRFLLVRTLISIVVGVGTAAGPWALGFAQPGQFQTVTMALAAVA